MTKAYIKKALGYTAIVFITLLFLLLASWIGGCSLVNTAQSAPANETLTQIIADAGAAANSAEQQYQAGTIPQNEYSRKAINDLGTAYNDAKAAYSAMLVAEIQYHAAINTQLASCAPAGGTPAKKGPTCADATANANTNQTLLNNANHTLNLQVSTLTGKITAVRALQPKQ